MNKYWFTFGYDHAPGIGFYVLIHADNIYEAREKMYLHFGNRWAFVYTSADEAGVDKFGLELYEVIE